METKKYILVGFLGLCIVGSVAFMMLRDQKIPETMLISDDTGSSVSTTK